MPDQPDLTFDPNEVGPDLTVECGLSQGPRAADPSFDPQPGDAVTLIDEDSVRQQGRVTRRDGDRVWVQITMIRLAPDTPGDLLGSLLQELAFQAALSHADRRAMVGRAEDAIQDLVRAAGTPPTDEQRELPTDLGMVCTCGTPKLAAANAALDRVIARLAAGSTEFHPHHVDRESFLTEVCTSLASMNANLESVYVDQWAMVTIEGRATGSDRPWAVVQCDRVEDGLATAWSYVAAGGFNGGTPPPGAPRDPGTENLRLGELTPEARARAEALIADAKASRDARHRPPGEPPAAGT